jgi:hypothetical protein
MNRIVLGGASGTLVLAVVVALAACAGPISIGITPGDSIGSGPASAPASAAVGQATPAPSDSTGPGESPAAANPSPSLPPPSPGTPAAYVRHVDQTFDTITAIFADGEGASYEQFATNADFAASEQSWIAANPIAPCLAPAARLWAAGIAALKADMDRAAAEFKSGNPAVIASANTQYDPDQPELLRAKQAIDAALAGC